jgi:hypothetical protein
MRGEYKKGKPAHSVGLRRTAMILRHFVAQTILHLRVSHIINIGNNQPQSVGSVESAFACLRGTVAAHARPPQLLIREIRFHPRSSVANYIRRRLRGWTFLSLR